MARLKCSMCFLYVIFSFFFTVQCTKKISRRSLFFPTTTVLQFTYGLSVPLAIDGPEGDTTILLSTCLQGNYDLPKKSSDLQVHDLTKRSVSLEDEDTTKIEVYYYILSFLRSLDIEGQGCLARMICEIAKYPLDVEKDDNVVEKIFQYILTPSEGDFGDMDVDDQAFYTHLLMAEEDGKRKENCETKYKTCKLSLSSLFSLFFID